MIDYFKFFGHLIRLLPPEGAHRLGQSLLRLPIPLAPAPVSDSFTWKSIEFRNRVGLAAGFDKDAESIVGESRLGFGYIEFGTVLAQPHLGNAVRPRLVRLKRESALWNCLGFPSRGVHVVVNNLRASETSRPSNVPLVANIGPHPARLKAAATESHCLEIVLAELTELTTALSPFCKMLVVNLSSPNTPVLRSLLHHPKIAREVFVPLRRHLLSIAEAKKCQRLPLLLKLPPEDINREEWTESSLQRLISPMIESGVIDGVVATNSSPKLSSSLYPNAPRDLPGGISGKPLLVRSLATVELARKILPSDSLLIGCGGITTSDDAVAFIRAGADLVQLYTGLVYHGPQLVRAIAIALRMVNRR